MSLLDQSGVTGGGLDLYNALFVNMWTERFGNYDCLVGQLLTSESWLGYMHIIGGSAGGVPGAILSFSHTFSPKSAHVGGPRPPPPNRCTPSLREVLDTPRHMHPTCPRVHALQHRVQRSSTMSILTKFTSAPRVMSGHCLD